MPDADQLKKIGTGAFVVVVGAAILAFGVETHAVMPDYAGVYLVPATRTYVPLPCVRKWKQTPGRVEAELSTAGDGRKLGYRIEDGCQDYVMGEQQTLGTSYLRSKGFLSPTKEWWDQPYRTDAGMIHPRPER